jgi:hypothetical protein
VIGMTREALIAAAHAAVLAQWGETAPAAFREWLCSDAGDLSAALAAAACVDALLSCDEWARSARIAAATTGLWMQMIAEDPGDVEGYIDTVTSDFGFTAAQRTAVAVVDGLEAAGLLD